MLLATGLLMLMGVTGAAVWFVGDRARLRYEEALRDAEVQHRSGKVNGEANDALDQTELHLKDLRARLDDPLRVRDLLSDIDRWQAMVEQARQAWQRAQSACVGNEALVAEETRARIRAVEGAISSEEAGYRLARELDDILAEALTAMDSRQLRLPTAKARFATFFSRLGVDIDQADKVPLGSVITSSPIRFALIAGLDHWANITALLSPKDPQLAPLLGLARAADPHPWRDSFRDPAVWGDRAALTRLAREVDVERQSPTILASLGRRLKVTRADATALYKQAVLCHPRDFWLHLSAALDAGEPGVQVGFYLAALAVRPNSAVAYSNLSGCLWSQGDLRGAVTAAKKALEINPRSVTAYCNLGAALHDSNDLAGAVAACKRAIELDPKSAPAYMNLGLALFGRKDLAGAVPALKKAIELDPKSTLAYTNLAVVLKASNDLAGAAAAYKTAIELDPNNALAYSNLGALLKDRKDLAGAVAACKRAIELDPKFAHGYIILGMALQDRKDMAGAAAAYKTAIELDPGGFQAHHDPGMAPQSQGRRAGAEQAYLGATQAQLAFIPAYNGLAWILATSPDDKVRDGKRAIQYATEACERTGWKVPVCLNTLAAAYAEAGQFEEAIRYQTRALGDPSFEAKYGPVARQLLELYGQKKPFRDQ